MSLEPYYSDEAVAIYHGDCREILPELEPPSLVIADPPYGVGVNRGDGRRAKDDTRVEGDDVPYDPEPILSLGVPTVLWGGNAYASRLPDSVGWLVWDKYHHEKSQHSQCELAWTNFVKGIRIHREAYHGFMRKRDGWLHPTQKPVGLFKWILSLHWTPKEGLIVDPYMGSGPTLVAAKDMNRRAVGIEIREDYCETAAKRLAQGVLDLGAA